MQETVKGMFILIVMESLMLTRDSSWLEVRRGRRYAVCRRVTHVACAPQQDHVDYLSCQALMFGQATSNLFTQAKLVFIRSRRLS